MAGKPTKKRGRERKKKKIKTNKKKQQKNINEQTANQNHSIATEYIIPTHKQHMKEKSTLRNTRYIQIGQNIQEQATPQ